MPRQSRERRQAFARYNSSREPMVVPHGLSVRLGCRAHQEHLLVLAVQTLSGKTRQEKSHHRGGAYPHRHWLSLAEEPEQLRGSWRKLLRSHPLRRSQAVFGEAAPTTRAQGNSRADGSCLTHRFPQVSGPELVRWLVKILRKIADDANVGFCGTMGVITALEFLQHFLA